MFCCCAQVTLVSDCTCPNTLSYIMPTYVLLFCMSRCTNHSVFGCRAMCRTQHRAIGEASLGKTPGHSRRTWTTHCLVQRCEALLAVGDLHFEHAQACRRLARARCRSIVTPVVSTDLTALLQANVAAAEASCALQSEAVAAALARTRALREDMAACRMAKVKS